MSWDAICALAERQHGVVSRAQVLAGGESVDWLKWAVRDGRVAPIRRGVYAVRGSASAYRGLMAACLAAGPVAGASHLASAPLFGAEQVKGGRLEITTFDNRLHRLPGVIAHSSRLDPTIALTRHRGIPIVVPALTVVQVAETCHPYLAKSVANDLVKRNWTDFGQIARWADVVGGRRLQPLRELCRQAIEVGGHDDSPAARKLAYKLVRAGVDQFELDYPVQTPDGLVLIDIAWPPDLVGLEYNGGRDHDSGVASFDDARRRSRLAALGWRMLDARRGMTEEEIIGWVRSALAAARRAV